MAKHLKLSNNHEDYLNFKETSDFILPNVSYCVQENEVHYNDKFMGHAYVDLGLPSGTLWATMNIGATDEWDVGDAYVWGETEVRDIVENMSRSPDLYYDANKWIISSEPNNANAAHYFTKYCSDSTKGYEGFVDNKKRLDLEDDAAHVNWGGEWHMPTSYQIKELLDNTTWEGGSFDGYGIFTSKINGKQIIFPGVINYRLCLSCDLNESNDWLCWSLNPYYDDFYADDWSGRGFNLPVRPVIGEEIVIQEEES